MRKRVYIIVGPTAVGKSDVALEVAQKLDAWIISADSRQIYTGMDIGTAKPSDAQRNTVKHFLIDIVNPTETFTAAKFLNAAKDAISFTTENGKKPLIVGGTGLYVRALVEGFDLADTPPDEEIRDEIINRLEEKGLENLASELHQLDPDAAKEIDINNPHRVIRALEIIKITGKSLNQARGKTAALDYDFTVVGLRRERESLNKRIENRTQTMIDSGWIDEVRELMKSDYPDNSPAMSGIGYMEIRRFLDSEITKEMAIERIITRTRQYAKRQMTWFNSDDYIQWIDINPEDEPAKIAQKVYNLFISK